MLQEDKPEKAISASIARRSGGTSRSDLEEVSWLAEVGLSWLDAAGYDIHPDTWLSWI